MGRPALCLAVCVLAALVAGPVATARVPDAAAAATCTKEAKRLTTFQRGMKAAKRRFFRTHRSAKARKRFVARQKRTLAARRRALRRCRAAVRPPAPAPAPVPAPALAPAPPAPIPDPGPGPSPTTEPPARDFIADVFSPAARFQPAEVTAENGVEYVRTQFELELAPGATRAAMDELLARRGAVVVSSLKGVGLLTVRVPDPGSLAAARALEAALAAEPALVAAQLATVPVTTELPDMTPADAGRLLRPQLASRAAGAWNARAGLSGASPTLVVTDYFGAGPPGPEVAVAETTADFATSNANQHGYTVLGLAAGTFEPGAVADQAADQVAGMWGGPDLALRVVDLSTSIAGSTLEDRLLQLIGAIPGDVVVSTSLAGGCAPAGCTAAEVRTDALQWIQRVRGAGLEGKFLHVVAAGNIYPNLLFDTEARFGSPFIAAAKTPLPVANLSNTIVVENTTASDPADGPIHPICLTDTSKRGGDVSTVGNDIKSLAAPGVARDLPLGGTSSAAPQLAGAAASLWSLATALSPAQVADILRRTARPVDLDTSDARCDAVTQPAPALDAYAAVLAADSAASQPARAAVLDADGDGAFDEQDLAAFRDAFLASVADNVVDLDYGRYDLNGDGYTGGGRDRIDLDATTPVQFTFSRRRPVLGLEIGHDERSVRDLDVLCHEVNGPLYTGDVAARDTFDEQYCLPPVKLTVLPAFPATLSPGQSTQLRVVARRTDLTDPVVSQQPGVHLEFTQLSGTLGAASGTTGLDGAFSTTAGLGPAGDFSVTVVARAGSGGPELDRITVTAARSGFVDLLAADNFLVANAEGDDEVKRSAAANYSDSVSAADKDATASATLASTFAQSAAGFTFTGVASISASDDGGGGDASSYMERRFAVHETTFFRLRATLQGQDPEETAGVLSLGLTNAQNPSFKRVAFGTYEVSGQFSPGDYTLIAEVDCSPDNEGGPCSGNFDVDLDAGDFITR